MCGIFGICASPQCNAVPIVLSALNKLTYRGYDSAGIAVALPTSIEIPISTTSQNITLIQNKNLSQTTQNTTPLDVSTLPGAPQPYTIARRRAPGKINNLFQQCCDQPIAGSTIIGHTRWATHGPATTCNAHPHSSNHFTLVHNGIIENYKALKNDWIDPNIHEFTSQTDTEHVVALLETFYEYAVKEYISLYHNTNTNVENIDKNDIILPSWVILRIVSCICNLLEGSFAFGIIYSADPYSIYALKRESPLCIGYLEKEKMGFLSSDASCLQNCNEVMYLDNDQIAQITSNGIYTFNVIKKEDIFDKKITNILCLKNDDIYTNDNYYTKIILHGINNHYYEKNYDIIESSKNILNDYLLTQKQLNDTSFDINSKKQPKVRMLVEINEQPKLVKNCLDKYLHFDSTSNQYDLLHPLVTIPWLQENSEYSSTPTSSSSSSSTSTGNDFTWSQLKQIYFIACGTSYHAGSLGVYLFERYASPNAIKTSIEDPNLYNHNQIPLPKSSIHSLLLKEKKELSAYTYPLSLNPLVVNAEIASEVLHRVPQFQTNVLTKQDICLQLYKNNQCSLEDVIYHLSPTTSPMITSTSLLSPLAAETSPSGDIKYQHNFKNNNNNNNNNQALQLPFISAITGKQYNPIEISPLSVTSSSPIEVSMRSPLFEKKSLTSSTTTTTTIPTSAFIFLSQSGETSDVCSCVDMLYKRYKNTHRSPIISLVNVPQSSLSRKSDFTINIAAGQELSVASTKAFTMQVLWLLLLVIQARFHYLASLQLFSITNNNNNTKNIDNTQSKSSSNPTTLILDPLTIKLCTELLILPQKLSQLSNELSSLPLYPPISTVPFDTLQTTNAKTLATCMKQLVQTKSCVVLGRGMLFPIALECALKLKELTYIPTEGCAAGELKHGPLAVVDKQVVIFALMPFNQWFHRTLSNVQEVLARRGAVYIITDEIGLQYIEEAFNIDDKDDNNKDNNDSSPSENDDFHPVRHHHTFVIPTVYETSQTLLCTLMFQYIVLHVAHALKRDIDQPRNLAKSVTVE